MNIIKPPNEEEWRAMCDSVVEEMAQHVKPFVTPISVEVDANRGEHWGTGNYLEIEGAVYLLTNEHVAERIDAQSLGHRFFESDLVYKVTNPFIAEAHPLDVAIAKIAPETWQAAEHQAAGIPGGRFASSHNVVEGELLFTVGYSGSRSNFYFGHLNTPGTPYVTQEKDLPNDHRCDPKFHFALPYPPDLAHSADERSQGLPLPPGLSGSLVWNTRFVENKMVGTSWSPKLAEVTGIVWGWSSSAGVLIATRVEHLDFKSLLSEMERVMNGPEGNSGS